MGLKKCPRCELNYIRDNETYCDVCKRYMKGEKEAEDAVVMCSECGENPAVRGSELCAICLREARRQEALAATQETEAINPLSLGDDLDDMEVELGDDDIPANELEEIDKELGDDTDDDIADEEEDAQDDPDAALDSGALEDR